MNLSALRRRPRAWLQRLPANPQGLNLLGLVAMIGLRWGSGLQLALALAGGAMVNSRDATVETTLIILFFGQAVLLTVVLVRRRSPTVRWVVILDVVVMGVLMFGQLVYAPVTTKTLTWEAWGYGVSISTTALIGMTLRTTRGTVLALVLLAGSYLVSIGPSFTSMANAAGYLFNGLVARFVWRYFMRLAVIAERAAELQRQEAIRRQEEMARRQKRLEAALHDQDGQAAYVVEQLRNLGRPDVAVQVDQARSAARAALLDDADLVGGSYCLGALLRRCTREVPAVAAQCNADDVDDLDLGVQTYEALHDAVRTLLINVQRHAQAFNTVIYGSVEATRWTVTVHDDGVGFDTTAVRSGYGINTQVKTNLALVGVTVDIFSNLGVGTTVVMTGPSAKTGAS